MKVNNSFQGVNPSDNNKKSTAKHIAKAAIIAGVVVGGAALCKNRKTPAIQKLAASLNDGILVPLKEKGVPFKEKISSIAGNIKQVVASLVSKRESYDDIIEIAAAPAQKQLPGAVIGQPALPEPRPVLELPKFKKQEVLPLKGDTPVVEQKRVLGLPEKSTRTQQEEFDQALKNLLYRNNEQVASTVAPIVPKADAPANALGEVSLVPSVIEPATTGESVLHPAKNVFAAAMEGKFAKTIMLSGLGIAGGGSILGKAAVNEIATQQPKSTETEIETAEDANVIDAVQPADGKKVSSSIDNSATAQTGFEKPAEAPQEATVSFGKSELRGADKVEEPQKILLNGKEFGGIFVDGMAYDEECEPLSGNLTMDFPSGKRVEIKYEDGVLAKSVIFEQKGDEAPETIKVYKDGKIHKRYEDITFKDNKFVANTVYTNSLLFSMLKTKEVSDPDFTRVEYYKNNTGKDGKIAGAPERTLSVTTRKFFDGSVKKKFYSIIDGRRKLMRISHALTNGGRDITYIASDKKPMSTMKLDEDKQLEWYVLYAGKDTYAWLHAENGKLSPVNLHPVIDFKKDEDGEVIETTYSPAAFKEVESDDDSVEIYDTQNSSRVIIKKDEEGYITSISSYINNEAEYPECETLFNHGAPVKDLIYDAEGNVVFDSEYDIKPVVKKPKEEVEEEPVYAEEKGGVDPAKSYARYNEVYGGKEFFASMWTGRYYVDSPSKIIENYMGTAKQINILDTRVKTMRNPVYKMLLDQEKKIQQLKLCPGVENIVLDFDEEGRTEDLEYLSKQDGVERIGPYKKNTYRYQISGVEVYELEFDDTKSLKSIKFYEDGTKKTPTWVTTVEDGAPVLDTLYDMDGDVAQITNYEEDFEDIER